MVIDLMIHLDADPRTSALLGTPSVRSAHGYYSFALEEKGRSAPMAGELVERLAILVTVRRFHGMVVADSRSIRYDNYVRMQHFVRRSTSFPFPWFLRDVQQELMQHLYGGLHGTLDSY
jgi:hypothetical protein